MSQTQGSELTGSKPRADDDEAYDDDEPTHFVWLTNNNREPDIHGYACLLARCKHRQDHDVLMAERALRLMRSLLREENYSLGLATNLTVLYCHTEGSC